MKNYQLKTFLIFSVVGRDHAWQFLKDNWKEFHDRYKGGFLLSRLVKVTYQLTLQSLHSFLPALLKRARYTVKWRKN